MKRRLLLLAALVVASINITLAQKYDIPSEGAFNFIVGSDLGRNGYYDQKKVAATMGKIAEEVGIEFIAAAGDTHHYDGVRSVHDPLWMTNYELIYSHPELMVPWFPVLGNHEYRGNTQAVIDYSAISRRWQMPSRYYAHEFEIEDSNTSLCVVFVDTAPMIDKYRKGSEEYPDAGKQNMEEQLRWIESTLKASKATWKIVIGHHPIFAQTTKSESERSDMQQRLKPILERNGVDFYFCGHIHNFQHIIREDRSVEYFVNTSGSLSRKVSAVEGTRFCSPATGFSLISAQVGTLTAYFVDADGEVIYTTVRSK